MANMVNILDTIRANASEEYQTRVPVAEQNTITAVGSPILTYATVQNEFLSALIGRIALAVISNKTAKNPLAVLKKGTVPLGSDIQDIFTNMAKDIGFDGKGDKLLTKTTPDTKVMYHRRNRQGQYPVTISKQQLATAFTSYNELEKMLNSVVTAMYSGDMLDEFILMKNLFATAIAGSKILTCDVDDVKDETSGKAFIKALKNASGGMIFPSSAFNCYFANKPAGDAGDPITTWTPLEDQVLIIRQDVLNTLDIDVLAGVFNLEKAQLPGIILPIDSFGSASTCLAVLADRSWVQVYDNLFETSEFYNSQGLYWNYWLNHWQTYSISLFANAVAFTCKTETCSLNASTLTFADKNAATQTLTATVAPSGATVDWITSNAAIATVSAAGVVTPKGKGTCWISAVNGDSLANCKVTVTV